MRHLKVVVVGKNYDDGFAKLIARGFRTLGHSVSIVDPSPVPFAMRSGSGWRRKFQAAQQLWMREYRKTSRGQVSLANTIITKAKALGGCDLVIAAHDFLFPKTITLVKSEIRCQVVMWFPDAISNFGSHVFLAGNYDALFFKDPWIVRQLNLNLNIPVYYLPEAFEPIIENFDDRMANDGDYACDIAIAGNFYAYRAAFLGQLTRYDLRIWGHGPPFWLPVDSLEKKIMRKYLTGRSKYLALRSAKICLNNLHPAEIEGINARAFEIAGAGGFQLISWRPAVEDLFVVGKEIVVFNDIGDLIDKIDYYLGHDNEREIIAAAGRKRAFADHTFEVRLKQMLEHLGIF